MAGTYCLCSSAKSTAFLCAPMSSACAVQVVLSLPDRDAFPVVCPPVPIFQLFLPRGHKPPVMPSAGSEQAAAAIPCRPKLVRVGSAAPAARARRCCAAAGLGASGEVSACAAECLIQQQNPRAASKPSWKKHLQASRLGGNIQCWMCLPARPVCHTACGSRGRGSPQRVHLECPGLLAA